MKKIIAALSVFLVAGFINLPTANADLESYLRTLAGEGYDGPIEFWTRLGNGICAAQRAGHSAHDIAVYIVTHTGRGIYMEDGYEVIGIANDHLCNPPIRRRIMT